MPWSRPVNFSSSPSLLKAMLGRATLLNPQDQEVSPGQPGPCAPGAEHQSTGPGEQPWPLGCGTKAQKADTHTHGRNPGDQRCQLAWCPPGKGSLPGAWHQQGKLFLCGSQGHPQPAPATVSAEGQVLSPVSHAYLHLRIALEVGVSSQPTD